MPPAGPLLLLLWAASARAAPPPAIRQMHVAVPMRDGVNLCANVFRPAAQTRLPALLVRTPYGKDNDITPHIATFIDRGYAVVVEDVRGRRHSAGVFDPLRQERNDGSDTIDWIAAQPWSDGQVGMMGGSYAGMTQYQAALSGNPHLKAIFPVVAGSDEYLDRYYSRGGALHWGQRLLWLAENLRRPGYTPPDFARLVTHLPPVDADRAATGHIVQYFRAVLEHPLYDDYWKEVSVLESAGKIKAAVFMVGGWYDAFVAGDLALFARLTKTSNVHRALIGPWPHNMSIRFPGADFGPESMQPVRRLQVEWFDRWLKQGNGARAEEGGLRVFTMGANRWSEPGAWPPPHARDTAYYLGARGTLSTAAAAQAPPAEFVSDPRRPVPTRGGNVCCNPRLFPWGPLDQREVEQRNDVLEWTTPPLANAVEVTGEIRALLYVSASTPDADFAAKLVDVFPDGMARILTEGILRLRYREGLDKVVLATPGEAYRVTVSMGVTSNVFQKDHRIRLEIAGANFPKYNRNPNTGRVIAGETELRESRQRVYLGGRRASHLLLPVVAR